MGLGGHAASSTGPAGSARERAEARLHYKEGYEALVEASSLARRGFHGAALSVLSRVRSRGVLTPRLLDLEARIHAQEGRLLEAHSCWKEAIDLEPSNGEYRACLEYLCRRARPAVSTPGIVLAGLVVVIGGLLFGVALIARSLNGVNDRLNALERQVGSSSPSPGGPAQARLLLPTEAPTQ